MQERGAAPPLSDGEGRHRGTPGRRLLVAGSVAAVVVAVDQVTKTWATHRLAHQSIHVIWKLDLQLTYNSGAAFSLAQGWAPEIGGLVALVVVILLGVIRRVHSVALAAAMGLIVGGAVGNLADRILRGHHGAVVDFIALHFWPTFNVADSCVVVGSLWAALLLWRDGSAPQQGERDHSVHDGAGSS